MCSYFKSSRLGQQPFLSYIVIRFGNTIRFCFYSLGYFGESVAHMKYSDIDHFEKYFFFFFTFSIRYRNGFYVNNCQMTQLLNNLTIYIAGTVENVLPQNDRKYPSQKRRSMCFEKDQNLYHVQMPRTMVHHKLSNIFIN